MMSLCFAFRSAASTCFAAFLLGCGGGGAVLDDAGPARYAASFPAEDVRLDSDPVPGRFPSLNPRIARDGDSIFVVWSDTRDLASSIRMRHSSDGGLTWGGGDVKVEHKPAGLADSTNPRLVASGERVYVVWEDYRDGRADVYFNRSLDGGLTWLDADRRVDTDPAGLSSSVTPVLATDGVHVVVAWADYRARLPDIHVNRSLDGGLTWGATDVRIDTDEPGGGIL